MPRYQTTCYWKDAGSFWGTVEVEVCTTVEDYGGTGPPPGAFLYKCGAEHPGKKRHFQDSNFIGIVKFFISNFHLQRAPS